MIQVEHLNKQFTYRKKELGMRGTFHDFLHPVMESKQAVSDVTFSVGEGECVGFIGPNGAGKTTTLKMLSGILYPTSGAASVCGYTPWERKTDFKRRISIVLGQKNQLWWDLPANESLYLNKCIYDIDDVEYERNLNELCEMLNVRDLLTVQVRNLSLGERMKMELVAALIHKPKVLFLDEPTIGLDLIAQKNIRDFLKYYNETDKTTIILTSHYLEDIENLCQRTIVINHGRIMYDGKLNGVNEKLQKKKIVRLEISGDSQISDCGMWKVRKREQDCWTLEIDQEDSRRVMMELLEKYPVRDFSISNVPLEESLEHLYQ